MTDRHPSAPKKGISPADAISKALSLPPMTPAERRQFRAQWLVVAAQDDLKRVEQDCQRQLSLVVQP